MRAPHPARGILRAFLRGDEAGVPVGEREWYRALLEETGPSSTTTSV
jgi:hypothetical protein